MLRWGGSSPAPPAPQCMPSPNKLPGYSAALPPESFCPLAPPQTGPTRLNTRAACPQPVGSATWQGEGGGKQLGHTLGLQWQRDRATLALRGQDLENHILGRPGAQAHRAVPDEAVVGAGCPSHLHGWV